MKKLGASGPSFETIVAAGTLRPGRMPSRAPNVEERGLVVLDQGAILRGYCSDMTRTVFARKGSQEGSKPLSLCLGGPEGRQGCDLPGVTAGEMDAAARGCSEAISASTRYLHTAPGMGSV